jgi:hypothetical protein
LRHTCTQGGVKVPTGGIPGAMARGARERSFFEKEVSRSGEKPGPTVTVRKEEDRVASCPLPAIGSPFIDPGILNSHT